MIIISSCERLDIKRITKVSTGSVSDITASSAIVQGNIIEQGEGGIKKCGHCWSLSPDPTINNEKTELGIVIITGNYISELAVLSPGTKYYVRAYATDNEGTSYGNEISFITLNVPVPATPTNLAADAESSSQITINWTDNSDNEEGFKIERSPNGTTDWTEIATVGSGITNFQNIDLTPSTTYYYRVRAFNAGGSSGFSNPTNATTLVNIPLPAAPTDLYADVISGSEIYLSWTDNSNNEAGFKIERAGANMVFREIATAGVDTPYFLNAGLTASVTYYYRVRAFNDGGNSDFSDTASATTLEETVPEPPSDLIAQTRSATEISINWTDNSNNEYGFVIELSSDGGVSWNWVGQTGRDTTSGVIIGLSPGITYYFRVYAFNAKGNSSYSNTASATTWSEGTVPAAPVGLTVQTVSSTHIELWWVDMSDNEEGFIIERSMEGPGNWTEIATVGPGTENFQDMGIANIGYLYYYRVRAYNSAGNSDYSNENNAIACQCPASLIIDHTAGEVAPVNKTVIYDVVMTNLTGVFKCWISKNLGATTSAGSPYDNTEESAGWYWQFNRKQGYKHDGSTRTPVTAWNSSIDENSDWLPENDPCNLLLGSGWRVPTAQELLFAYYNGGWSTFENLFSGPLRIHAAGSLSFFDGALYDRGGYGNFWSSSESNTSEGQFLLIIDGGTTMNQRSKANGYSLRCIHDGF